MKSPRPDPRIAFIEIGVICVIALIVGCIHFWIPPDIEASLIFKYRNPDPFTAFTAAYFHINNSHLFGNIRGYLAGALAVYFFCLLTGERRWFWLTTLFFLTILPIFVNYTSFLVIGVESENLGYIGRGFSGIVSAYAGFLVVSTSVVLQSVFRYGQRIARDFMTIIAVIVASEIAFVFLGNLPTNLLAALIVGIALAFVDIFNQSRPNRQDLTKENVVKTLGAIVLILLIMSLMTWYVLGLFPAQPASDDSTTNILAHYVGMVYGGILSIWGYRYWKSRN